MIVAQAHIERFIPKLEYMGHEIGLYEKDGPSLPAWKHPDWVNWEAGHVGGKDIEETIKFAKVYLELLIPQRIATRLSGEVPKGMMYDPKHHNICEDILYNFSGNYHDKRGWESR